MNSIDNNLRIELQQKIIDNFQVCPEIYAIILFGRHVEGAADQFSDIDIILCSNDMAATQSRYLDILQSIAPIISSYIIVCENRCLAQMCMLKDYSPYQKIDFSITDNMIEQKKFGPFAFAYLDEAIASESKTLLSYNGNPRQTLKNQLNDLLFSIPRFTKCLFRGDRNLYRRWFGVTEHLAKMLYEKYFEWNSIQANRLNPYQYKELYKVLTPEDELCLQKIQPIGQNPIIPTSFLLGIRLVIDIYKEKSNAIGQEIDTEFSEYIYTFLEREISRYLSNKTEEV